MREAVLSPDPEGETAKINRYHFQKGLRSMSFNFLKTLPTPAEIRSRYPLTDHGKAVKKQKDQDVTDVITGQSDKFLVIIGPCSADNETSVLDYVSRLARVQEKVF